MINCPGKRNGFPFVLIPWSGLGDAEKTRYPAEVSLAKASEWYWRVKQWKVEYDVTYMGTSVCNGTRIYGEVADERPYNEANLIERWGWDSSLISSTHWFDSGHAYRQVLPWFYVSPGGARDGSNVRLNIRAGFVTIGPVSFSSLAVDDTAAGIPETTVTCTVDGEPIEIFCEQTQPGWSDTTTITITPHKYWTYGGKYDEDTGELV